MRFVVGAAAFAGLAIAGPVTRANEPAELVARGASAVGCGSQTSFGSAGSPAYSPDTASGFQNAAGFASAASAAAAPPQYTQAYSNLQAATSSSSYIWQQQISTYDPQICAVECNTIKGCAGFNIFFQREPAYQMADACPNPPSIANIMCVYYGDAQTAADATNVGQWAWQFNVVIAGSNAYNFVGGTATSTAVPTVINPPGYTGQTYLAAAAINAPLDSAGYYTYMGYANFPGVSKLDPQLCATKCTEQTVWNLANPPTNGEPARSCQFFNTYLWYNNTPSNILWQTCAMYTEAWDASYATNTGQYDQAGNHYQISNSYTFSNTTGMLSPNVAGAAAAASVVISQSSLQGYCSTILGISTSTSTLVSTIKATSTSTSTTIKVATATATATSTSTSTTTKGSTVTSTISIAGVTSTVFTTSTSIATTTASSAMANKRDLGNSTMAFAFDYSNSSATTTDASDDGYTTLLFLPTEGPAPTITGTADVITSVVPVTDDASATVEKRADAVATPNVLNQYPGNVITSACSLVLASSSVPTVTATSFTTVTSVVTASATSTSTSTSTTTSVIVAPVTATVLATSFTTTTGQSTTTTVVSPASATTGIFSVCANGPASFGSSTASGGCGCTYAKQCGALSGGTKVVSLGTVSSYSACANLCDGYANCGGFNFYVNGLCMAVAESNSATVLTSDNTPGVLSGNRGSCRSSQCY